MTKKDYELIARTIRGQVTDWIRNDDARVALKIFTDKLSAELERDNPRFNASKFKDAAGVNLYVAEDAQVDIRRVA